MFHPLSPYPQLKQECGREVRTLVISDVSFFLSTHLHPGFFHVEGILLHNGAFTEDASSAAKLL